MKTKLGNGALFGNKLGQKLQQVEKRRQSVANVAFEVIKVQTAKKEVDLAEKRKKYLRKADTVFLFDPKVHMNLSEQEIAYLDKLEDYENNFQWFTEVAIQETGKSFGERALIEDVPRAATVQALTDCYFAVLNKDAYLRVLKKLQTRAQNEKLEFFTNLPFLKG